MFDSNVLEVGIGMIVCFASTALIASSLQEALASVLRLRARTLLTGINELLNGQNLVVAIYNHALVNPRSDGKATSIATISKRWAPSYIEPANFARALVDSLQKSDPAANMRPILDSITDPQVRQCLCSLYERANLSTADFEASIAKWFDSAMDRVAGAYKRQTQLLTFVLALVVAVALNIDAYRIMISLWAISTHGMLHVTVPALDQQDASKAFSSLAQLPIGWVRGQSYNCDFILGAIPGWIVAATSTLFGAPFWFGILGKVAILRGAGDKPKST